MRSNTFSQNVIIDSKATSHAKEKLKKASLILQYANKHVNNTQKYKKIQQNTTEYHKIPQNTTKIRPNTLAHTE